MKTGIKVRFKEWDCRLEVSRYSNGRLALLLVEDRKDGESVAVASVNLPFDYLGNNEVFIKDYSENEGMLNALNAAGIIEVTGERVWSGFAQVDKVRVIHPELVRTEEARGERAQSRDREESDRDR
jgi:hypothetical protein